MWEDGTWYEVAIFWTSNGKSGEYGGVTRHKKLEEATAEVSKLKSLGYGKTHNPIHVRRVTVEVSPGS